VLARYLVAQAVKSCQGPGHLCTRRSLVRGPGYWSYATHYTVVAFAAMQSALGTDFDLSNYPGLAWGRAVPHRGGEPSGKFLQFCRCRRNTGRTHLVLASPAAIIKPVLAVLARQAAAKTHPPPTNRDPAGSQARPQENTLRSDSAMSSGRF